MNAVIPLRLPSFMKGILAIVLMSLCFFGACKKENVTTNVTATVTGFSPTNGPAGTVVVISGANFSAVLSSNSVTFNGEPAVISSAAVNQITATCPSGATSGKIFVTVVGGGGTAASGGDFTVVP